jgi:hypothetical protein
MAKFLFNARFTTEAGHTDANWRSPNAVKPMADAKSRLNHLLYGLHIRGAQCMQMFTEGTFCVNPLEHNMFSRLSGWWMWISYVRPAGEISPNTSMQTAQSQSHTGGDWLKHSSCSALP